MSEELLLVQMESGITCKDGRHFVELVCSDQHNKDVRVLLPSTEECEQEVCDQCSKYDTCEIMCPFGIEFGRKIIIVRAD
jgi:hypothetical protein